MINNTNKRDNKMKIIGYIIAIIGFVVFLYSIIPQVKAIISTTINLPKEITQIPDLYLTIGGIIIMLLGALIISKSSRKTSPKGKEVPIYEGGKLVGFRRV